MAAAFGNSSMLAKRVRELKDEQIELECYRQVCRANRLQVRMFLPLQTLHGSIMTRHPCSRVDHPHPALLQTFLAGHLVTDCPEKPSKPRPSEF